MNITVNNETEYSDVFLNSNQLLPSTSCLTSQVPINDFRNDTSIMSSHESSGIVNNSDSHGSPIVDSLNSAILQSPTSSVSLNKSRKVSVCYK